MSNVPITETKIIKNFLTEDEIKIILDEYNYAVTQSPKTPFYRDGVLQNYTFGITFTLDNGTIMHAPNLDKTRKILNAKVAEYGDVRIGAMHFLESFQPYKCHTDACDKQALMDDQHYGAHIFVIPLETVDSATIVFNEWYPNGKTMGEYLADNPNLQPKDSIDEDIIKKYLNSEHREYMRYLSIDTIFPWVLGDAITMSRYKFHGSDNFPGNGIKSKFGIIIWTVFNYGAMTEGKK